MSDSRLKRIGAMLRAVFLVTLSSFLIMEVGSRIYLANFASDSQYGKFATLRQALALGIGTKKPASRFKAHRYMGIVLQPNHKRGENTHNALGFRGPELIQPKPEGEFRIVCVGGSTTYSTAAPMKSSYPLLLQQELRDRGKSNVVVVNAGVPAWTTWESLINFEFRLVGLDPDLVLVYHAENDLQARFVWPLEAYREDNSGSRVLDDAIVSSAPALWEHSTFLRIFAIEFGFTEPRTTLLETLAKPAPTWHFLEYHTQKRQGVYPQGIFEIADATRMLDTNKPIYFRRNIEHLIAIARYRNIQPVLVTFAHTMIYNPSMTEYHQGHIEMNSVLTDIAKDNDVPILDFASEFPKDAKFFADDVHLNAEGTAEKAAILARMLVEQGLL